MIGSLATRIGMVAFGGLLIAGTANANGLALTPESEVGFKRFMRMAEDGRFGSGVDNANVGISKQGTRIELVYRQKPVKHFHLTAKTGDHSYSRFFDIALGDAAAEEDLAVVGAALDAAFEDDPYRISGVESAPGWSPPPWRRAWRDNGWRGLLRGVEMRSMEPVSLAYALGITTVLVLMMALSCVALWLEVPSKS